MAVAEPVPQSDFRPLTAVLHEWVTTVDHKRLGLMYLMSGLFFFVLAGIEALIIRWQLAFPNQKIFGEQTPMVFNQMFTMHGTTMVFFVGMPILIGFANYLVPLMIGARDMAFPRLNAFSFWMALFGGLLTYFSFLDGGAPDFGWFAYAPLTELTFSRNNAVEYWAMGLTVSGIGTLGGAVNLVSTILTMRAPGMSLGKLPLFVWMMLMDAFLILIAFPPLTAAQIMIILDRILGAHFFDPQYLGSAVLWQHIFWFFGHPEVYILVLPGFGIVSEVIPVFARKVIFGYESVAAATIGIGFISLGVWAHHMFTVGLSKPVDAFFSGATFLIAIPTGIKIFNWVATLYGGKLRLETPLLFCVGFLSMFVIGGITGIWLAVVPMDWQLSDSYFVVGHFHFVLFGGLLFALFAGTYYWFPKMTGRMLSDRLGKWHFWLIFIGFNLTFIPMHFSGMLGMARRIYTYQTERGWDSWNLLTTAGALVQVVAVLVFLWNVIQSLGKGKVAGEDPWDAWTLEWATTSPPPSYNFEVIPTVRSRRPLWDLKHPSDPDWKYEGEVNPALENEQLPAG